MFDIKYNKKMKMLFIQEFKGTSKSGKPYHFIRLLQINHITQSNQLKGKCYDCLPYYPFNLNLDCGDIIEVLFDKHSPRNNPQILEFKQTGENIFKMVNCNDLIENDTMAIDNLKSKLFKKHNLIKQSIGKDLSLRKKNTVIYNHSTHNGDNKF